MSEPVPELAAFRAKYPDYNDLSDGDLAGMLAKKYPDAYGDLPGKVAAPVKPEGGGFLDATVAAARTAFHRTQEVYGQAAKSAGELLAGDTSTESGKPLSIGDRIGLTVMNVLDPSSPIPTSGQPGTVKDILQTAGREMPVAAQVAQAEDVKNLRPGYKQAAELAGGLGSLIMQGPFVLPLEANSSVQSGYDRAIAMKMDPESAKTYAALSGLVTAGMFTPLALTSGKGAVALARAMSAQGIQFGGLTAVQQALDKVSGANPDLTAGDAALEVFKQFAMGAGFKAAHAGLGKAKEAGQSLITKFKNRKAPPVIDAPLAPEAPAETPDVVPSTPVAKQVEEPIGGLRHINEKLRTAIEAVNDPVAKAKLIEAARAQGEDVAALSGMALKNPFSGLDNTYALRQQEKAGAIGQHMASGDLNGFGQVNKTFGKPVGDAVLTWMGEVFGPIADKVGVKIVHPSGDELLWHANNPSKLHEFADKVRAYIQENPMVYTAQDGTVFEYRPDFGYSVAERKAGQDLVSFLKEADAGAQAAKDARKKEASRGQIPDTYTDASGKTNPLPTGMARVTPAGGNAQTGGQGSQAAPRDPLSQTRFADQNKPAGIVEYIHPLDGPLTNQIPAGKRVFVDAHGGRLENILKKSEQEGATDVYTKGSITGSAASYSDKKVPQLIGRTEAPIGVSGIIIEFKPDSLTGVEDGHGGYRIDQLGQDAVASVTFKKKPKPEQTVRLDNDRWTREDLPNGRVKYTRKGSEGASDRRAPDESFGPEGERRVQPRRAAEQAPVEPSPAPPLTIESANTHEELQAAVAERMKSVSSPEDITALIDEATKKQTALNEALPKDVGGAAERFSKFDFATQIKAAMKENPKVTGDPNLANPGTTEQNRSAMDVVIQKARDAGFEVTDKEAKADAEKMLFHDYEGTVKRLESEGPRSVADVFAQKDIINRKFTEAFRAQDRAKLSDAARFAYQYVEGGSEQARMFRARADSIMGREERAKQFVQRAILNPDKELMAKAKGEQEIQRVLDKHVREIERIAIALKKIGIDIEQLDTLSKNPDAAAAAVRIVHVVKGNYFDKQYEYWMNGILSAPTTHVANVIGNILSTGWDFTFQRTLEATANLAVRDPKSAQFGEFKYIAMGLTGKTLSDAWRRARFSFSREMPVLADELGFFGTTKFEGKRHAIEGTKGRIVRIPSRLLVAADEMAKSIIYNMELGAQSYRIAKEEGETGQALAERIHEIMNSPKDKSNMLAIARMMGDTTQVDLPGVKMKPDVSLEAATRAWDKAEELTFQNRAGTVASGISSLRTKIPGFRYVVPFVATPANIMSMGLRKSPLGILGVAARVAKQGAYSLKLTADGSFQYRPNLMVRDAAEQVLAWGTTMAVLGMVAGNEKQPLITGSGASFSQPGQKAAEDRTKPPQSIRIGDKWVSYSRLEPLSTGLTVMVDAAEGVRDAKNGKDMSRVLVDSNKTLVALVRDKTFMQGIGDIIRAMESPDKASQWLSNFSASFVPNLARSAMRSSDPMVRDYAVPGRGVEWAGNLAKRTGQKMFPLAAIAPPPKVDLWGREVEKVDAPGSDFLYRLTVPIAIQKADGNIPDRFIMNWNNQNPNDGFYPSPPPRSFKAKLGKTVDMTDEQYNAFAKQSGKMAFEAVSQMGLDPNHPSLAMVEKMQAVISKMREATIKGMFGKEASLAIEAGAERKQRLNQ